MPSCPADTDARASKSLLFTILVAKFTQLKHKQYRYVQAEKKETVTIIQF